MAVILTFFCCFCFLDECCLQGRKTKVDSFCVRSPSSYLERFGIETRRGGGTLTVSQSRGKIQVNHNLMAPAKTCVFPVTLKRMAVVFLSLFFSPRAFALAARVGSVECFLCIVLREEAMMAGWRHRMLCHSRLSDITSCEVSPAAGWSAPGADGYVG